VKKPWKFLIFCGMKEAESVY